MTVEIRAIDQRTFPDVADGLLDVYRTVFFEPPWCEEEANAAWFLEHVEELLQAPGTRLLVPMDAGRPVGFALGGDWDPDDHWCDAVTEAVGPDWTNHCFHLMELALLPTYRGQGLGGRLHDALLAGLPHRTAILSTNRLGPPAAAGLYVRRGWRQLLSRWSCCEGAEELEVLGLLLRPGRSGE